MMKSGTLYKQRDIVLIPFPFTDLTSIKQRPALIISNDEHQEYSDDVVICGITSHLKESPYSVIIDNTALVEGIIPITSRIKTDKLFTLKKSLIKKKIAVLKPEIFNKVKDHLHKLVA